MDNNYIFRRIRYILDLNDDLVMKYFRLGGIEADRSEISAWLKTDEDEGFEEMIDIQLAVFLNGLIVYKRGVKDGKPPVNERKLTNNMILRKIKIAFSMQSDDLKHIWKLADRQLSETEISAFFRNPKHAKYKNLNDQYLRNFITGWQIRFRGRSKNKK